MPCIVIQDVQHILIHKSVYLALASACVTPQSEDSLSISPLWSNLTGSWKQYRHVTWSKSTFIWSRVLKARTHLSVFGHTTYKSQWSHSPYTSEYTCQSKEGFTHRSSERFRRSTKKKV